MMFSQRNALLAAIAVVAISNANAFTPSHSFSIARPMAARPLYENSVDQEEQLAKSIYDKSTEANSTEQESKALIMDMPPTPKPAAKKPVKKAGNPHKEGVFSPLVIAAGAVLGEDQLNKIRAKSISLHSDIIKSFVNTADSTFGKTVLRQLFNAVDVDKSGYLDKEEVGRALNLLGFKWLQEKHVEKIFERADLDANGEISLEEFMEEAPKTLRTNLVKLAKANGGDMGLLV